MAKTFTLPAASHTPSGKGSARALRRSGHLPAVIYGGQAAPAHVAVSENAVNVEYLRGHIFTSLCTLNIKGGVDEHVLVRDVQLHPVTDRVIHVDFIRVTDKTTIAVWVPVQFINEDKCPGLATHKGTLAVVRHEVELLCPASHIPEYIEVDLSNFENGESIHISSAALPPGITPTITDRDFTIATLQAPRRADEEEETPDTESQTSSDS